MKKIRLNTLEEALQELEKLENARNVKVLGQWSQAQILSHLRFFLEGSMKGFPESRSSFIRESVGPNLLKNIKQIGYMPSGFRNSFLNEEKKEISDTASELKNLRNAIQEFKNYTGKLKDHPIYGELSREDWDMIHAYHTANHLSFLDYGSKSSGKTQNSKTSSVQSRKPKTAVKKKTQAKSVTRMLKTKAAAGKKAAKKKSLNSASGKKASSKKSPNSKKKRA